MRARQTIALPGYLMVSLIENMSRLSQASTWPVQWHALINFTTLSGNSQELQIFGFKKEMLSNKSSISLPSSLTKGEREE